jgi:hypothetical protein
MTHAAAHTRTVSPIARKRRLAACAEVKSRDVTPSTTRGASGGRPAFADRLESLMAQKMKDNAIPGGRRVDREGW